MGKTDLDDDTLLPGPFGDMSLSTALPRIADLRHRRSASTPRPLGSASRQGTVPWVRLFMMIGLLAVIVASLDRAADPKFYATLFEGLSVDTTVSSTGPSVQVVVDLPASTPSEQPETPPTAGIDRSSFNPLGLVQIDECTEVTREAISAVVQDKTPSRPEEALVLQQLLCRAATTSPETLARESRRDLLFANLVHDSDRYRGTLIHRRGVLQSVMLHETDEETNRYGLSRYYQGWMFTDDQPTNPTVVVFARLPEGISPGEGLSQEISIDAFYFKLLAFRSKDGKTRFAPMLVGDMPTLREKSHVIGPSLAQALGTVAVVGLLMAAYLVWQRRQDRDFSNRIGQTLPRPSATNSLFEEP
jgi:hypothetical protein